MTKLVNSLQKAQKRPSLPVHRAYGTGKRKNAIARVWIYPGSGEVMVNNKLFEQYFTREVQRRYIMQPFEVTKSMSRYNVVCTVKGGGHSGQAGALLHGLSKALCAHVPDFHKVLRDGGFLTRDSRVVERKKYGQHKARKSTQFSKR